jgi:hypothetical protein
MHVQQGNVMTIIALYMDAKKGCIITTYHIFRSLLVVSAHPQVNKLV